MDGVPSPCRMVRATVCLSVMRSLSDITDVSTIVQSFKTNFRRSPLFHVAQYRDDVIGRVLNLDENCLVGIGSRTHNLPNDKLSILRYSNSNMTLIVFISDIKFKLEQLFGWR